MSELPRPKKGLVDETAKDKGTQAAVSALHTKTRVVKFDDFQSSFFPARPSASQLKVDPGPSNDSCR